MAMQQLHAPSAHSPTSTSIDEIRKQETALARMLMTYIVTGLAFMLLPGTFLGVWNLLSISAKETSSLISPAWIQAHGHAQVFGWIGTFILGIGFYSIPKMRRAQPFAMWQSWMCWTLWTSGVLLRWIATVYAWRWRVAVPLSAGLELLAFAIFFVTVSSHRPVATAIKAHPKLDRWIFVVIIGAMGLLATLITNLVGTIDISLHASSPAFGPNLDQRYLVLMTWGFMVPFVWGFSARWLPTFLGLRTVCERELMLMVAMNATGVVLALLGVFRIAVVLLLAAAMMSLLALKTVFPAIQPAKTQGVHKSFPFFVRLAYIWLIVGGVLGVWAAFAQSSDGIWGASRHALTVGFIAMMVFSIGQRVLPAFSGMRILYSPKLMAASLVLLSVGCLLRVSSEILAYQQIAPFAWKVLPVSAVIELSAVTVFAINIIATFLTLPPSERLVQSK